MVGVGAGTVAGVPVRALITSNARSGSGKTSRSIQEIKLVFERNKGPIYAIYNRALRDEPGLQGKVEVELEVKLLARIRLIDFSAKDVEQMGVTRPVDLFPS